MESKKDQIIVSDTWGGVFVDPREDNWGIDEELMNDPTIQVSKTIGDLKTFDIPGLGKI